MRKDPPTVPGCWALPTLVRVGEATTMYSV
jgi:hypothetical protein